MNTHNHYTASPDHRLANCLLISLILAVSACTTQKPSPIDNPRNTKPISVGSGFHKVQRGETLSSIGRRYGQSASNLARWNNLTDPSKIEVGQIIRVKPGGTQTAKIPSKTPGKTSTTTSKKPPVSTTSARPGYRISLQWPAAGKVIQGYNPSSNKGINIGGNPGDPVKAAAAGKVAYAGSALRQYGNLIIIKHDSNYLTVYAHNQAIQVKEGDSIKAGQQIATMGNTGSTSGTMLHFELRYQGNTIDPTSYLPAR